MASSLSDGRSPELSEVEVSLAVCKYFEFSNVNKDSVKALPGYNDRNYYFEGATTSGKSGPFILKIYNDNHTSVPEIEGCFQVMQALQASGITRQVPERTREGANMVLLSKNELKLGCSLLPRSEAVNTASDETPCSNIVGKYEGSTNTSALTTSYAVAILPFVCGEVFDKIDKKYLLPSVLQDIGKKAAKMDIVLQDFRNKALEARKNANWNLYYFMEMKVKVQYVSDPVNAEQATVVLDLFDQHVTPHLQSFRQSIIQGDISGLNLVMEKRESDGMYQYSSFIDFGDIHKTCTVFELAVCLAYFMIENLAPKSSANCVEFVKPVIDGYTSVIPLTKEESGSLYYMVLVRCIQSAVNGEANFAAEPWNTYILTTPQKAWALTELLLEMGKDRVDKIWLD